jgi:hypothetical protein
MKNLMTEERADEFKVVPSDPRLDSLIDDPDLTQGYEMGPPSPCPDLRGKSNAVATKLMVEWFSANFEDPAERTPYDSAEGGYIYIWGDPSTAEEELVNAFGDVATEKAIAAAVEELEAQDWEWVPSGNRMQPEEPRDTVIAAKQRLFAALENWWNGDFDKDKARFRIADVALLLCEHHRLRKIEDGIRAVLAPEPATFKPQEQSHE